MTNPFRYLLPVEPLNFVGRWKLVKSIASDLIQVNGDSYAIISGRRCGKSSLLKAISHQVSQHDTMDSGDYIPIPIYFDFKGFAETIESAKDIYAHIFKDIYKSQDNRSPHQTEEYLKGLIKSSAISIDDFETGTELVLRRLRTQGRRTRFILLLDEIDSAIDRPWTQALFSELRYLIVSSKIMSCIRLVVTGSHRFLEQVSLQGSPLWNSLKLKYLEPFDREGFNELIKKADGMPGDAVEAIWLQSGGHPFLAQYLLHHLWEQGMSKTTSSEVNILATKFLAEQTTDIEGWARAVGEAGLEAYGILSAINDWVDERGIIQAISNPSLNVKRGIIGLCYHGFVLHDDGWANYKCIGNIFKNWYNTYGTTFRASLENQKVLSSPLLPYSSGREINGLTWIHLSDWHQKGKDFNRKFVRDRLLRDIRKRNLIDKDLAIIDFIVFSGDVAHSGQPEEYQAAIEQLFNPVLKECNVSRNRLFIVPGNHDLDRAEFEFLPAELTDTLKSNIQVDKWLTSTKHREALLKPFQSFSGFVNAYTGQDQPNYANARKWEINGKKIAVLGFNSAWMCGRHKDESGKIDDKGFIIVGRPQIHDLLEHISDADIKIAVIHHPFDLLADFDCNQVKSDLINECNFILNGHQHKPEVKVTHSNYGDCAIIPAGACYNRPIPEDPRYINAYNFVHLNFDAGKGFVFLRRWSDPGSRWIEDIDSWPKGKGKFEFNLPRK